MAARIVFLSLRLLPLILMDMYVGVSCFALQVSLNQMAAAVLCSNRLRVLNWKISRACWAFASVDNKHLIVASCWFSLSLHNLLMIHGHRNLKNLLYLYCLIT